MTVPRERALATLKARDFLERLLSETKTPGVPAEIRAEAKHILRHFPLRGDVILLADRVPDWWEMP